MIAPPGLALTLVQQLAALAERDARAGRGAHAGIVVVFAHLGHWYVGLPVYSSPVVAIYLWIKISEWRRRRRQRDKETGHR